MGAGNWAGIALAGGLTITGYGTGASLQMDAWDTQTAASVQTVAAPGAGRAIVLSKAYAEIPSSGFSDAVLGLLASHGFTRTDAASADLWLRAHLRLKRGGGRQEPAPGMVSAGPAGRGRASAEVEVVLELIRRATGEPVWSGLATATLDHPFWSSEGRQELVGLAARLLAPVRGAVLPG